jgi:hypothetical protein
MNPFTKKILKYLPIQFHFFNTNENISKNEIKSTIYNAEITIYPFTKPISKIINLDNAQMESK